MLGRCLKLLDTGQPAQGVGPPAQGAGPLAQGAGPPTIGVGPNPGAEPEHGVEPEPGADQKLCSYCRAPTNRFYCLVDAYFCYCKPKT